MSNTENVSPQPLATPIQELPVQQPPQPPQPPPVNKTLSKPLLFGGILVFVVISTIAGGAHFLGLQKTSLPQQQVEGWKMYTSPSGDFTIQYPSHWEYLEKPDDVGVGFGYPYKEEDPEIFLVINFPSDSEDVVYQSNLIAGAGNITSKKDMTLDGIKAKKLVITYSGSDKREHHWIVLSNNSRTYEVFLEKKNTTTKEVALAEKALSTLRFSEKSQPTESSQQYDTSTWQTYKNTKFSYEVKYPQDWTLEEKPYGVRFDFKIQYAYNYVSIDIVEQPDPVSFYNNLSENEKYMYSCGSTLITEKVQLPTGQTAEFTDKCFRGLDYIYFLPQSGKNRMAVITTDPVAKDNPLILAFLSTFKFTD